MILIMFLIMYLHVDLDHVIKTLWKYISHVHNSFHRWFSLSHFSPLLMFHSDLQMWAQSLTLFAFRSHDTTFKPLVFLHFSF